MSYTDEEVFLENGDVNLAKLKEAAKEASDKWEGCYGYNNGGIPTGFLKIPNSNSNREVEMLVDDVYWCCVTTPKVILKLIGMINLSTKEEAEPIL